MNKKELRKAIIELPVDYSGLRPKIDQLTTLELIKLLDELEKVKVPQFVADWYEENKHDFEFNLWRFLTKKKEDEQEKSEFYEWMNNANNKPLQTLVNMHQFGYEVEEEPRYTVKVKSTKCSTTSLVFSTLTGAWFFPVAIYQGVRFKHTRKELEDAGFGWVFDCDGVEIEEVTE